MACSESPIKVRISVVGAKGVGKSAFVVRYLTREFLREYSSTCDFIYHHATSLDTHIYDIEICDVTKNASCESLCNTTGVDAFIVVYSIDDFHSFEVAQEWYSSLERKHSTVPLLLIGNKSDHSEHRQVSHSQGLKLGGDLFKEVSSSDGVYGGFDVRLAMYSILRRVTALKSGGESLKNPLHQYLDKLLLRRESSDPVCSV